MSRCSRGKCGRNIQQVEVLENRLLLSNVYVDVGNAAAAPNGSSWADAYQDLQAGLAAARFGDKILIAAGTYLPTSGTDRTVSFILKNGVEIDGGYAGSTKPANPDARDIINTPTILSGDIGVSGDSTDNSYHVVDGTGADASAVLDGVSITAGNANGSGVNQMNGGGLLNGAGTPLIRNCTFTANSANMFGGGIFDNLGAEQIVNCTFSSNSSVNQAGAGGAICIQGAATPKIIGSNFVGNTAKDGAGVFAGLLWGPGSVSLTNCTFTRNSGGIGGGVMLYLPANASVTNCVFDGNSAIGWGGGLDVSTSMSSTTISNCVFSGNKSIRGANLDLDSGSATAVNSSFYTTADSGGGIWSNLDVGANANLTLTNGINWGGGPDEVGSDGQVSASYSDAQTQYAGAGNISADPQFTRTPSPGPDGLWCTADDDYGDLSLRRTSPAIDAGDNAALPAGTTTDVAGNPRFVDVASVIDTGQGTAPIVDMGAYEAQYVSPVTPIANAGGPYSVPEGGSVLLNGGGSSEVGGSIAGYTWDLNYDGQTFTADTTGKTASFSAAGLDGPLSRTIALRVTDAGGQTAISATTVSITNVAPTAKFSVGSVILGSAGTASFSNPFDPSTADVAAGFKYSYDFNNDGKFEITDSALATAAIPAIYLATPGNHTVHARIEDKDGGFTDYTATIQVIAPSIATISGTIFNDANSNGALDAGEKRIAGRTVFIDKNLNGKLDSGEVNTTTSGDGSYSFKGLAAGSYRIGEVLPAGWRRTNPALGYYNVALANGQTIGGMNFAETQNALITGSVYNDANGNARRDTAEKGLAGRTVFIDKNKNGKLDAGELSTVTASDGSWSFKTLPAGSYRVAEVLPAGWRRTNPTAGFYDLTVTAGQIASGKDFADTAAVSISGTIFKDANKNGRQDASEPALSGWVVFLDANNDGKLDSGEISTTTDSKGNYNFVMPAGKYNIREVLKSGFTRTTPTSGVYAITLTGGQTITGRNFGD